MTLDLSSNINAVVKIVACVILPNEGIGLIFFRCLNESYASSPSLIKESENMNSAVT